MASAVPTSNTSNTGTTTKRSGMAVVDLLSIGSKRRPDLMQAQRDSFGSHRYVRHFFTATEDDDADPSCHDVLSEEDVYRISKFCRRKPWDATTQHFMRNRRGSFARIPWLQKKANPVGWMCAQRRPIHGLYHVLMQALSEHTTSLPDYLVVMDDDTYVNVGDAIDDLMQSDNTPEVPLVTVGCLVRNPIMQYNFTLGFGGYGTFFNKASLEYLRTPVHCPRDTEICNQIQSNQIGESELFQNGMSLIELSQAHATDEAYREERNWTRGYCLHSDW
jgi:hypothetical protein